MKPEFKYGTIAGLGVCVWTYIEFLLGLPARNPEIGAYAGYLSNFIVFSALYFLLRYKHARLGPLFSVLRGTQSGVTAAIISALLVCCFLAFYQYCLDPSWFEKNLKLCVDQMRASGLSEENIRTKIVFLRNANSPVGLLISTLGNSIITNTPASILFSLWFLWRGYDLYYYD